MDAPAGADLSVVCIEATSESALARYLSEIDPDIADPDWDEAALPTINDIAFGVAVATGIIKVRIRATVPVKPKVRKAFSIMLLPNYRPLVSDHTPTQKTASFTRIWLPLQGYGE